MSVPRPAMLVAMVIAPGTPAWATIKASCSWKRAFSTAKCRTPRASRAASKSGSSPFGSSKSICLKPSFFRSSARCSDFSMEVVPTRIGWPLADDASISLMIARYFSSTVR